MTQRWLYQYRGVSGAPAALADTLRRRIRDLLSAATDEDLSELTPEGDLLLYLPSRVLGRDLHKVIRLHTGVAEQRGTRTCIPLQWTAEPGRHAFPRFDGTIELDPLSTWSANLAIVGAATIPLGPIGATFDATVLKGVADRTLHHLVGRLAENLEQIAGQSQADTRHTTTPPEHLAVADVMTPAPLVLHDQMPLKTGALLLFHYDVTGAPVQNDAGGLVGVLSESDLIDLHAPPRVGAAHEERPSQRRSGARTVGDACTRPAREVTTAASVWEAAGLMRDSDIARLIVVDGSEVVGIISRHDVLKALVRSDIDTQRVLQRVLAAEDADDVTADVRWGVAHLSGRVLTRSQLDQLLERIQRLDGVVTVDADLTVDIDGTPTRPSPT